MSYSSEVLADSPLAYWRLGEASGTSAADSSGNARSGTYNNTPTLGVAGALASDADTSVTFASGSSEDMRAAFGSWLNINVFTLECWVKTTGSNQAILGRTGGSSAPYSMFVDPSGFLQIVIKTSGTSGPSYSSSTVINDGNWHHCVITRDGSANLLFYVDGANVHSVAASSAPGIATSFGLAVGSRGNTPFLNGTVDEAAIYGTALSGARVAAHYNAASAISVAGEAFITAATMLDGSPQTAITIAGEAFVSTATMLDGSASSGPVLVSGEVFASSAVMLDGTPLTAIRVDGEVFTSATTMLDGLPRLIVSGEAFGSAVTMLDGFLPGLPVVVNGESFTVDAIALDGSILILAGADTSNALRGRERGASASVQVLIPASAVTTATKVDKAIALPVPTMVNGRPT